MFKEMRRNDRQISDEEARKLLEEGQYGVLSTVGENGYAYGMPLNYVYLDGNIYFHCALEGAKLDNIEFNDRVSFCVVGNSEPIPEKFSYRYISTVVFGNCSEVTDDEKQTALVALIKKYSGDFMEKGMAYIKNDIASTKVMKITIEHLSGKARR
ncbi:MAG: transporter [Eubacterium sp.]|jgi:nitroimidazol reductase NimA-like FMN-containing flavoprotein (pyridoxamine 5'-phosphate oxidase superfamily)|nr:transporter [Eubacterium sp.]